MTNQLRTFSLVLVTLWALTLTVDAEAADQGEKHAAPVETAKAGPAKAGKAKAGAAKKAKKPKPKQPAKPTKQPEHARDHTVGSDRDAHGCIASAGYRWCARTGHCERPWELARTAGFENSAEAYDAYCGK